MPSEVDAEAVVVVTEAVAAAGVTEGVEEEEA